MIIGVQCLKKNKQIYKNECNNNRKKKQNQNLKKK